MTTAERSGVLGLRVGELVEVRSEEEILATLDENGELDSLPFMPEMLKFCGQRLTVHKVAHKLCDTISSTGMRKMEHAVHLTGARCDGSAHGGCQTACSMYWKESWVKRVGAADPAPTTGTAPRLLPLLEVSSRKEPGSDGGVRYSCQATELMRAAPVFLPFKSMGQYVTDVRTGNVGVLATVRGFFIALYNRYQAVSKRKLPRRLWINGGLRWSHFKGGASGRTPVATLDLKPGELVRIKSREEIIATLDDNQLNRGMGFEEEMARYCGQTSRVQSRVERVIDEKTGELLTMKTACIVLEDLVCAGFYNRNCPREFVPFWREIWLERV
ncbi:MAG: hypothetical protein JWN00_4146 [Actinomycetia bacterium]|nr:hypothetical protein [Actinomycetes bacterium]